MTGSAEPGNEAFLPFARPTLGEEEIAAVVETLRGGWLTMGPKTAELERAVAAYCDVSHAGAVSSCTAALHLSLLAHGVEPGDEVIVPSLTFVATANVVEHAGARPVFADVDPASLNVTAQTIEEKLTPKTKAVIAVHYAGLPCDLESIRALCERRGVILIEDAAHAIGARYRGRPIGSHGQTVCFSFYANKNMTTGEGGMVVTRDAEIAQRVHVLRLHGMSHDAWRRYSAEGSWRYDVLAAGFKYNLTDLGAALGLVQLRKLDRFIDARAALVASYREALRDWPGLTFQAPARDGDRHAHHLFVVRFSASEGGPSRDAVIAALKASRIGFSVHFLPVHLMTHYRERWGGRVGQLPETERAAEELLSLPLYPEMTTADVERVVGTVRACAAKG